MTTHHSDLLGLLLRVLFVIFLARDFSFLVGERLTRVMPEANAMLLQSDNQGSFK